MECLTSANFTMKADVLRQTSGSTTPTAEGEWQDYQDPVTLEIVRRWVPVGDNPSTPNVNEGSVLSTIRCSARGIIGVGLRAGGTTEVWGDVYSNVDFVRIEFSPKTLVTKRDRITNIRDADGHIVWLEEELNPEDTDSNPNTPKIFRATVFDVEGVTPVFGPFNTHMKNVAMLQRAEIQQYG
jgi:hypothetical protein